LIGLVALEAFGAEVGVAALALAAIYPVLIETSSVLVAENLLVALELAAVYCGLRIRRAGHPYRWTVLAGVLAGLAALAHQDAVVLVPPLAIATWSGLAAGTSRLRAVVAPAAMIVAFVLTITPWMVRNAIELHRLVPISDQAGETLFGTYNSVSAADQQIPYKWRWAVLGHSAQFIRGQSRQARRRGRFALSRAGLGREAAGRRVRLHRGPPRVATRGQLSQHFAVARVGGLVCVGVLDGVDRLATRFRSRGRP
jgi:4-amino-4-deoxy-L-arabinose transferase-like glycosyltransferase